MKEEIKNCAFVDGQNLYLGTTKNNMASWQIDLVRFKVYLEKK
jgi:hypothetical protein